MILTRRMVLKLAPIALSMIHFDTLPDGEICGATAKESHILNFTYHICIVLCLYSPNEYIETWRFGSFAKVFPGLIKIKRPRSVKCIPHWNSSIHLKMVLAKTQILPLIPPQGRYPHHCQLLYRYTWSIVQE